MDANQRSESNNQTNNGANEKWTPGSKGNTTSGPMDHTYPQGSVQQQGQQDGSRMGTQQSGAGPAVSGENWFEHDDSRNPAGNGELRGGSMQSQQTGGSGPQQGITDSHQRQMEIHSEAWGLLEQPVGRRPKDSGTDVGPHGLAAQSMQHAGPQSAQSHQFGWQQESEQSQRFGQQSDPTQQYGQGQQSSQSQQYEQGQQSRQSQQFDQSRQTQQQSGPSQQTAQPQLAGQSQQTAQPQHAGQSQQSAQQAQPGQTQQYSESQYGQSEPSEHSQQSVDRAGSQTGPGAREAGTEDVHQSNDVSGGLPRSPGNSGPRHENTGWQPGGSMQRDPAVHQSNDVAGGLPRSPAGANRLSGDRKMDDDTGFSRK